MVNINDFMQEKNCMYKGEVYSVRDNGAIMRHCREGMRKRKLDEVWTFGNPNYHTGYMEFGGERVHRIVATAFHGEAPSDQHVVDHIDTNRRNNRPNNLRWLTKLENILCNEITRKKVELICGSVEAFLNDPTLLFGHESEDPNFTWMKNVTPEEAQNCLENWKHWAKTASPDPNYKKRERRISDRIYDKPVNSDTIRNTRRVTQPPQKMETDNTEIESASSNLIQFEKVDTKEWLEKTFGKEEKIKIDTTFDYLYDSLTPSAKQRYWKTPTAFPFCPENVTEDGLKVYLGNLKVGEVFSKNERYSPSFVVDMGMGVFKDSLIVLTTNRKNEFLSWAITTITIENNKYVHENTEAKAGKELSIKYFKYLTGQGDLSDDDINTLDAIS